MMQPKKVSYSFNLPLQNNNANPFPKINNEYQTSPETDMLVSSSASEKKNTTGKFLAIVAALGSLVVIVKFHKNIIYGLESLARSIGLVAKENTEKTVQKAQNTAKSLDNNIFDSSRNAGKKPKRKTHRKTGKSNKNSNKEVPLEFKDTGNISNKNIPVEIKDTGNIPNKNVPVEIKDTGNIPDKNIPVEFKDTGNIPNKNVPVEIKDTGNIPDKNIPVEFKAADNNSSKEAGKIHTDKSNAPNSGVINTTPKGEFIPYEIVYDIPGELFHDQRVVRIAKDKKIYRSGMPLNEQAILELKDKINIKKIICFLRKEAKYYDDQIHSYKDIEELALKHDIEFELLSMDETKGPTNEINKKFLKACRESDKCPMIYQCHSGQDRAGIAGAIADIEILGMSFDQAYNRMLSQNHDFASFRNLDIYLYEYCLNKGMKPEDMHPREILEKWAGTNQWVGRCSKDMQKMYIDPVVNEMKSVEAEIKNISNIANKDIPVEIKNSGNIPNKDIPVEIKDAGNIPNKDVPVEIKDAGNISNKDVPVEIKNSGNIPNKDVPVEIKNAEESAEVVADNDTLQGFRKLMETGPISEKTLKRGNTDIPESELLKIRQKVLDRCVNGNEQLPEETTLILNRNIEEIREMYNDDPNYIIKLIDLDLNSIKFKSEEQKIRQKIIDSCKELYDPIPEEIAKIRNGKLGEIREKLTVNDIMTLIDHQLMSIKSEDITKVIDTFEGKDRELALEVLTKMTQFGNMQSLDKLVTKISNNGNGMLFDDIYPSLTSNLKYLDLKGSFSSKIKSCPDKGTLVLDETTLEILENNSKYLNQIRNNPKINLVYPEGWINGIHVFNQTADIEPRLKSLVKQVNDLMTKESISKDKAIHEALNRPILNRLTKLRLQDKVKIEKISEDNTNFIPTVEKIVDQLKPASISKTQLEAEINEFPESYRPYLMELMAQDMTVYSPRSISDKLKKLYQKIIQENGGTDKGIYYLVPRDNKSYGMVTMQYKIANNIPCDRILTSDSVIPWKDAKKIVILDDLAASGDSLEGDFRSILFRAERAGLKAKDDIPEIVIAPLISSDLAVNKMMYKEIDGIKPHYLPFETLHEFHKCSYAQSLKSFQQEMFTELRGHLGYIQNGDKSTQVGLSMVFPYMSPDNNAAYFRLFSKYFTLNGKGIIVLTDGPYFIPIAKSELYNRTQEILNNCKEFKSDIPEEIAKIQRCIPGKVRKNLTVDQIMKLIDYQIMAIKPQDITKAVNSLPEKDRELGFQVLERMTQFGNPKCMDDMIKLYRNENFSLSSFGTHSVPSGQNVTEHKPFYYGSLNLNDVKKVCVLDEITLEKLEKNPNFLQHVKESPDTKILYPEGWINGINPFNQSQDIETKLKEIVANVNQIRKTNSNLTLDESLYQALNKPIIKRLDNIGLLNKLEIVQDTKFDTNSILTAEEIAERIKPKSISKSELKEILNKYPEKYRPYCLELLAQNSDINSANSMSCKLKKLHEKIIQENGGTDEGIYFHSGYSRDITTLLYKITNNIPLERIISDFKLIPAGAKKIVVLQDIEESGDWKLLHTPYGKELKSKLGYNPEIIKAPIIATKKSIKNVHATEFENKRMRYMPYEIIDELENKNYYKYLPEKHLTNYKNILGNLDQEEEYNLNMIFPDKAPRSLNSKFFNAEFAKYFVHENAIPYTNYQIPQN